MNQNSSFLDNATKQYAEGEKVSKKFEKTFQHLRRNTTYLTNGGLWASMQAAGITEADLPAIEATIQSPGFGLLGKFTSAYGVVVS